MGDSPSFSWRSIISGRPTLRAGVKWRIGDGNQVNIWRDHWIPNCPQYLIQRPAHTDCERVADLIDTHQRVWIPATVRMLFRPEVAEQILAIPLSRRTGPDKLSWSPERHGNFTVKTVYWVARQSVLGNVLAATSDGDPFKALWKGIWNTKVPGKVQTCVWRAANNLLPTRERLLTKGYSGEVNCLLCTHRLEDTSHLFCKCPLAVELLSAPPFHLQHTLLPSIDFKEWLLERALTLKIEVFEKLMMILWGLWKNRNSRLWENVSQTAPSILLHAMAWLEEFQLARSATKGTVKEAMRHWKPELGDRSKMNVDGAFMPQMTKGGVGGILRNSQGHFVAAFAHTMQHIGLAKQAELCAIQQGLDLAKSMQLQNVTIESDCLEAVQQILSADHELDEHGALLDDIVVLMASISGVQIQHAPRVCNNATHRLAALAFEANQHEVWIHQPPECLHDVIQYDLNHAA